MPLNAIPLGTSVAKGEQTSKRGPLATIASRHRLEGLFHALISCRSRFARFRYPGRLRRHDAGCGKPGQPNSQAVTTITVGGTQRTYLLTLPSDYATTTPQRLYFVYHGAGGNHDSMTGVGLQTHAIGIFPDGVNGRWSAQLTGPDIDMFDAVLAAIEASTCVDTTRIYATGFSFGASMANALGCARGDVLRAFSSVDGGILFGGGAGACKRPVPAWVNHYLMDPTDPYMQDGIPTRDLVVSLNSGANPVAYDAPNPCVEYAGKQPFVWCTPPGAFHQWPDFATASMQRFFDSL